MTGGDIWIWGRHAVEEALRAGGVGEVLLATGRKPSPVLDEIRRLAHSGGVAVREVPPGDIERRAPGQNTQGVMASVRERVVHDIRDLLGQIPSPTVPYLLALDQVQDPHNLGALLRTAVAVGVNGVVVPERRSAPITGVVAKTSAGAVSKVTLCEIPNLSRTLDYLRAAGLWTVGLAGDVPQSIFDADLTGPVCLIVGGEGAGLRRLTRQKCDLLVRIPMPGPMESLNASVAGSIAMYEVLRQRLSR